MGTISSAFSLVTGALDADQQALNVVANNVANANTPGYTTETPNWQQNTPIEVNGTLMGDGVTETGATSQRDLVLQARLDQQQQLESASSTRMTALDNIQSLFTPDSGSSDSAAGDIGNDITNFFDSFSTLEGDPTDDADREAVLSAASTLAGDISSAASSLNSQSASLNQEAAGVAGQVNSLTSAIAQLNLQIESTSPDADAGTLEDQRQEDISQLSQLVGINQVTTQNNGLEITTTSGQLLVSEGQSYQLTTGTVNGNTDFFLGGTDITSQLASGGGQLGGYLTAIEQDIPSALSSLDQLAYGISTSVNALNSSGTDLNGDAGGNIFNEPTQVAGSAAAMTVVMTDPDAIAAAGAGNGTGDDSNAVAMANLANSSLIAPSATTAFSITQNLNSSTPVGDSATGNVAVYDSLGNSYQATVTYTNEGGGQWNYEVSLADELTADTSTAGQVSYTFGSGETMDPGTDLTITGVTATGGSATITAPTVTAGEAVGDATNGYVQALDNAMSAAGITGVTVTNNDGVLTISGATATSGSVIADAAATGASGTLTFDASGNLTSPNADVTGITFSGLSDGASPLSLTWDLYGTDGAPQLTQTAAASTQTGDSQNGSAGDSQTPIDYYSNFVSTLGSTVSEVQTENAAQNASVTQLQTQNDSLSSVNLNDEAAAMSTLESSYQAASQVFTMLNTIMASALNLGVETAVS